MRSSRRGFSLIEVVVALVLLVVGVLGVATIGLSLARLRHDLLDRRDALRAAVARGAILRREDCTAAIGGTAAGRGHLARWSIQGGALRRHTEVIAWHGCRAPWTLEEFAACDP